MHTLIYNISKYRNNFKKPYGESCFIMNIFRIKLKFWHRATSQGLGVGYLKLEQKESVIIIFFILVLLNLVGLTSCRNIENACSYDGDFNPFDICVKKCLKFISRTNLHGLRLKIRSDSDLQLHQTINIHICKCFSLYDINNKIENSILHEYI